MHCYDQFTKKQICDPGILVKKIKKDSCRMSHAQPTQNRNLLPHGVNWLMC